MADVMSMEEIRVTTARLNIDLDSIDLESIRLLPGEDFGIISDDDDLKEEDPLDFEEGFGNIIVVDNLPVVPKEKFEKLEGVVRKIYSQIGTINGSYMPEDAENGKSLGYCFIEYNTPQEAELAKEKTDGYKLDRSHIFSVSMFDDIEKWAPPETRPYTAGENLQKCLPMKKPEISFCDLCWFSLKCYHSFAFSYYLTRV